MLLPCFIDWPHVESDRNAWTEWAKESIMSDVKEIAVEDVKPVVVGKRVTKRPPPVIIKMVNDRASHFYFRRVLSLLHSLGKYR
jgi:hypothetical protein